MPLKRKAGPSPDVPCPTPAGVVTRPSAVGARLQGDDYQIRFFWGAALQLLMTDYVDKVEIEAPDLTVVDDVVVHYRTPRRDALGTFSLDCCQLKYHVTQNGSFTFEAMLDPAFTRTKLPILRRLYDTYLTMKVRTRKDGFRLRIVSPWGWHPDDPVARCWATEGHLRGEFFQAGRGSQVGKIRTKLASTLGIDDASLADFLTCLRFEGGATLQSLNATLRDRLQLASLKPLPPDRAHSPYDDLGRKLIQEGIRSITREWLFERLKVEGLVVGPPAGRAQITLKSRLEWATKPLETQSAHLDLTGLFGGRFPRDEAVWSTDLPARLVDFLSENTLGSLIQPIEVFFDCHLSIAFAAGSLLNPKSGLQLVPVQKTLGRGFEAWECPPSISGDASWIVDRAYEGQHAEEAEVVVMVSVTHEVDREAEAYLTSAGLDSLPRLRVRPSDAIGPLAVRDAAHGWSLAMTIAPAVRAHLPRRCRRIHLFYSGPAALAFLIAANSGGLPPIQVYEHDFEGMTIADHYYPTLELPLRRRA